MSKNISIQEGGVAKQLTVDKLKTNLVSSGTCLWVPEDEVQLTTKTITENGKYKASDDGYYGYSEVTVSGIGTVSGTDPTTGEDVVVGTDPETGEITETTVPHSIRVVTPPYNPYGIYQDGQTITTDGMEVRALLASGDLYDTTDYPEGLIPNGEITLNPTTAIYDETTDQGGTMEGDGVVARILSALSYDGRLTYYIGNSNKWPVISTTGDTRNVTLYVTSYNGSLYAMIRGQERIGISASLPSGSGTFVANNTSFSIGTDSSPYDGIIPSSSSNPTGKTIDDMEQKQGGSRQTINVSWPRPRDGKVLETTFEILVAPGYTPGGGE